jgi:two-component system, chemotaxis family, chemotaxis protein CheY
MSLNVLVVDDSACMRAMIVKTLRMTGLPLGEVHEAANGQEGLAALREHWLDLVLVDINMPVMNGEEMLEQMRADTELRDLPVIVVSTEGSQTRIERLEQKGARFIHKPFAAETVREVVEQVTGVAHEQTV